MEENGERDQHVKAALKAMAAVDLLLAAAALTVLAASGTPWWALLLLASYVVPASVLVTVMTLDRLLRHFAAPSRESRPEILEGTTRHHAGAA